MLRAEENEILTRVGPGTLMGELLRRYWTPACLTAACAVPPMRRHRNHTNSFINEND